MRTLRAFGFRLLGLLRARPREDDFAAEIESHVALHTDDGIRAGLTPEEARRRPSSVSAASSKPTRLIANAALSLARFALAGHSLRPAHTAPYTGFHHHGCTHTRPRHRRVHGYLQPGERGAHSVVPVWRS